MREHTHLPAMASFVSKHVAQHFRANRPRLSPAVSPKLLDAAPAPAERHSSSEGSDRGSIWPGGGFPLQDLVLRAIGQHQLFHHELTFKHSNREAPNI